MCLQHGVPLKLLCEKFAHTRFEPSGWTGNEQIGYAKSIMDYLFRWMQLRFLSGHQLDLFAGLAPQRPPSPSPASIVIAHRTLSSRSAAERTCFTRSCTSQPLHAGSRHQPRTPHSSLDDRRFEHSSTTATPPQQGIAPDLTARSGLVSLLTLTTVDL